MILFNDVSRCANLTCEHNLQCKRYLAWLENVHYNSARVLITDFKPDEKTGICEYQIKVKAEKKWQKA